MDVDTQYSSLLKSDVFSNNNRGGWWWGGSGVCTKVRWVLYYFLIFPVVSINLFSRGVLTDVSDRRQLLTYMI